MSLDLWFYYMGNLTSVTGWESLPSVCSMYYTFGSCSSLATLDLSAVDPSTVTRYDSLFANCSALATVYVSPTWEIAHGATGRAIFWDCDSIVGATARRSTRRTSTWTGWWSTRRGCRGI